MKYTNILNNQIFKEDKVSISVLLETETSKEIRILFKKGQEMKKHQTAFPITVEIVDGQIDFGVENKIHNLTKGDIVALNGGVPHDLLAKEQSIVRLTLSKLDNVERVNKIVD